MGELLVSPRVERIHRHSQVIISSEIHGDVIAAIPEDYSISLEAEWGQLSDRGGGGTLSIVASELTGYSTVSRMSSAQAWQGSAPIDISLSLLFQAEVDAKREVVEPIKRLSRMALPRSAGSAEFLIPPGSRVFNLRKKKEQDEEGNVNKGDDRSSDYIVLKIGTFAKFDKVIITSVAPNMSGLMSTDGRPMSATCDVNFRTFYLFDQNEMERTLR